MLNRNQSLAFVMSPRFGDALLSMVIVNNLARNGFKIDVFSNYLFNIKNWFPNATIFRYPDEHRVHAVYMQYDVLLHTYAHDVLVDAKSMSDRIMVLDDFPIYRRCIAMLDLQVEVCGEVFGLIGADHNNGLCAPNHYMHRKNNRRVVIHPSASLAQKCWLPKRFIKLAIQLQQQGYQPEFIVSPDEKNHYAWVDAAGFQLNVKSSLSEVAAWIYESGWFIGNDSGIGHLASNLGIPTVSLMCRPKNLKRWRPKWALGYAIKPSISLIHKSLKERYWKYLISVRRVKRVFNALVKHYELSH